MRDLNHENLVKLIDVRQNATYKSKHQVTYICFAIILEYVGGGQLFDYIADTGKFSEKVTRTYFHQLMNALYYMHSKGYAHRDIKPQNILLSQKFILKLADFGFSCILKGKDNSGTLHTKLGTEGYMAPEILNKNYNGAKTDIFAAGAILFIMYAGSPPFQKATPNDPYYKLIKQKRFQIFWGAHSQKRPVNYFNDEFKNIFQKMVAFDPQQRISIQQIANHPWVTKIIATYDQIKNQFVVRQQKLDKIVDKRRKEQQKKKQERMNQIKSQGNKFRGSNDIESQFYQFYAEELASKRVLPNIILIGKDEFIVKQDLGYLISTLKFFLKNKNIPIQQLNFQELIGETINTLKFKWLKDDSNKILVGYQYIYGLKDELINQQICIKLTFGHNQRNQIIMRVQKQTGNHFYFKKIIREIKNQLSYCLV